MDAEREGCIVSDEFFQVHHDDGFGLGCPLDRCFTPHVIGVLVKELFRCRVNMCKGQDVGHIQTDVGVRFCGGMSLALVVCLMFKVVM